MQGLLDGVLAPLRNTHKFELVVRLPLLLAAAHAGSAIQLRLNRAGLASWVAPVMSASLVAALAAPGIAGSMPRPEGYAAIPGYWRAAATWLDMQETRGSVLLGARRQLRRLRLGVDQGRTVAGADESTVRRA